MKQPTFPLFQPAPDPDLDDLVFGVSDVLMQEVRRAAMTGTDPDAIDRVRFSLDLTAPIEQMLQALATALGSSRRSMAAKLLTGAIVESVNTLHQAPDDDVEMQAVRQAYQEALESFGVSAEGGHRT